MGPPCARCLSQGQQPKGTFPGADLCLAGPFPLARRVLWEVFLPGLSDWWDPFSGLSPAIIRVKKKMVLCSSVFSNGPASLREVSPFLPPLPVCRDVGSLVYFQHTCRMWSVFSLP